MVISLSSRLRASIAALMYVTGESQRDLAAVLGLSQGQVSRRQSGAAAWSLEQCEALAAHWGIDALDLLAGPTRASEALPEPDARSEWRPR
ncbi:helix-turn-helix domain-containing protein [Streptomyces sp. NPDC004959]|uniref:helix-turn-helix domain-containing protein n=1 Tax=Streptomyces sp. NPDC004959 TaxID=3154673 RepID=UPI0033A41B13